MTFRSVIIALVAGFTMVGLAGHLSAKPALKDVASVSEGIIAVGIAYEISERCSSIRARTFRGIMYLNQLQDHARGLGYSQDEIDSYVYDRDEKRRLEQIARQRLAAMGAVDGNEASYCAVGQNEISRASIVGQLLR